MTTYDRLRAAADEFVSEARWLPADSTLRHRMLSHAAQLRADANRLETVERELREWANGPEGAFWMVRNADRVRGEGVTVSGRSSTSSQKPKGKNCD